MTPSPRQGIIDELIELGHLPSDDEAAADPERYSRWEALLTQLSQPASDAEALLLTRLFPQDESDSYGLAWSLLHLIETAPGWPLQEAIAAAPPYWGGILSDRLKPKS